MRGCGWRKRRGVRGSGLGKRRCERVGLEIGEERGCERVGLEEERGVRGWGWRKRV